MNAIEMRFDSPFYVTGGTLSRDALCYVVRQADHQLYDGLHNGHFCYVLTARQMGKSSLMVRTACRLRDDGVGVAVLDLTAIGQNLTAEQWYGGLLTQMAQQLGLEDELEEFWDSRTGLGPLQRWMQTVRQVVLPRYPGQVVVFIDEIDAVRSLPFSTDEFFAGIREFYNRRTEDLELNRLSFCLLGVAAPSDLIRDTRMTPFNIGQRIELPDFIEAEAQVLTFGMVGGEGEGAALIGRILYWTGGHPYLTQRLCQAVAEQSSGSSAYDVDRLCSELFFARRAREQDDNLLFVRERLLRSEVELAGLLSLYEQVHRGTRVEDDETSPLISVLRLSGIVRSEDGHLRVRNRIYKRVFDREWVTQNMPDAEVRRQRAAYRRGLLRAAAVAALILAVIGTLSVAAVRGRQQAVKQRQIAEQEREKAEQQRGRAEEEARRADSNAQNLEKALAEAEQQRQEALNQQRLAEEQRNWAEDERDRAEEQEEANRRLLYSAHMNLAARDWQDSSVEHMRDLLALHEPRPGQSDLRGFD
jgi:AAA-like domain